MDLKKLLEGIDLPSDEDVRLETANTKRSESNCHAAKSLWTDESFREKVTASNKEAWADKQRLENSSRVTSERWAHKSFHEETTSKIRSVVNSDEWKASQAAGLKEYWSSQENTGVRAATNNSNFKGMNIGTNLKTGEEVCFDNQKDMKANGFLPSKIYECINGNRKSHKGYAWRREEIKKGQ